MCKPWQICAQLPCTQPPSFGRWRRGASISTSITYNNFASNPATNAHTHVIQHPSHTPFSTPCSTQLIALLKQRHPHTLYFGFTPSKPCCSTACVNASLSYTHVPPGRFSLAHRRSDVAPVPNTNVSGRTCL